MPTAATWRLGGLLVALAATVLWRAQNTEGSSLRCVMYLTGQHPVVPPLEHVQQVTHVILAFMGASMFNEPNRTEWPIFGGGTTVNGIRSRFAPGTKVMVAIGGWGDTQAFSTASRDTSHRQAFAENVARMVFATGADGVDLDWEFPGGNGEDYKIIPNKAKEWEIDAYPVLIAEIRKALGPNKIISAAVPGGAEDMIAFTWQTVPRIMRHLDFLNVMTYDMAGRRNNVVKHHTDVQNCLAAIDAYVAAGAAPQNLNLGFAFFVKWFLTEHEACSRAASPLGCPTLLGEDPNTGADLGRVGAFSWHDQVPEDLEMSFAQAVEHGVYDDEQGGYYFWDENADVFWTFDTADAITRKFPLIVDQRGIGGVFAWGLGEDAPTFEHFRAVSDAVAKRKGVVSKL